MSGVGEVVTPATIEKEYLGMTSNRRRTGDRKMDSKPLVATGLITLVVSVLITSLIKGELIPFRFHETQETVNSRLVALENNLISVQAAIKDRYTASQAQQDFTRLFNEIRTISNGVIEVQRRLGETEKKAALLEYRINLLESLIDTKKPQGGKSPP